MQQAELTNHAVQPRPGGDGTFRDRTTVLAPFEDGPEADPMAELDRQMRRNSFFLQASLEQQGKLATRLDAYLTGLLDVLIEQGVVDVERLSEVVTANRRQQAADEVARIAEGGGIKNWPTVVVREDPDDDEESPSRVAVDCEARMPICKAVCCSLKFPLSPREIEAGRVKWDLGHPYVIRHSDQGFCVHNDRASGRCAVYENRPQVCRDYSCATDERIWKDFDAMVLNEEFLRNRTPERFQFKPDSTGSVPVTFTRKGSGGLAVADEMAPAATGA